MGPTTKEFEDKISKFFKSNKKFKIDKTIEKKLLITVSPNGFLKCVK